MTLRTLTLASSLSLLFWTGAVAMWVQSNGSGYKWERETRTEGDSVIQCRQVRSARGTFSLGYSRTILPNIPHLNYHEREA